jgi:hypothetical protein
MILIYIKIVVILWSSGLMQSNDGPTWPETISLDLLDELDVVKAPLARLPTRSDVSWIALRLTLRALGRDRPPVRRTAAVGTIGDRLL